jgi:hypothetical protein
MQAHVASQESKVSEAAKHPNCRHPIQRFRSSKIFLSTPALLPQSVNNNPDIPGTQHYDLNS